MSTTDNAFSATLEPIDTPKTTLKQRWWHIMDNWKVGIVPLPLFLLAGKIGVTAVFYFLLVFLYQVLPFHHHARPVHTR